MDKTLIDLLCAQLVTLKRQRDRLAFAEDKDSYISTFANRNCRIKKIAAKIEETETKLRNARKGA